MKKSNIYSAGGSTLSDKKIAVGPSAPPIMPMFEEFGTGSILRIKGNTAHSFMNSKMPTATINAFKVLFEISKCTHILEYSFPPLYGNCAHTVTNALRHVVYTFNKESLVNDNKIVKNDFE
jgi:hypothetical protein